MYPAGELSDIVRRKAALRRKIAGRRLEFTIVAGRALQPLAWIDAMRARWRGMSPLVLIALVPLTVMLRRQVVKRLRTAVSWMRWIPLAVSAVRTVRALRR